MQAHVIIHLGLKRRALLLLLLYRLDSIIRVKLI